jgi:hypothetical protein
MLGSKGAIETYDRLGAPTRQIRAKFGGETIRVYQAFSDEIAMRAVAEGTFMSPFKRSRMTWIKPSFCWMMYRSGWASKAGQERVVGVDISRSGFETALSQSCLTHFERRIHGDSELWRERLRTVAVRVQWDPERTVELQELPWRTIQIGLKGTALDAYLDKWISHIEDVTELVRAVERAVREGDLDRANSLLPVEDAYPLVAEIAHNIGCLLQESASESQGRGPK